MSTKIKTPDGWKDVAGGKWYPTLDWDRGEYMSNPGNRTYNVPERGIVYVSDVISQSTSSIAALIINGHIVATMGAQVSYMSSGSFPVDKGDVVQTANFGSRTSTVLGFVPYKAQ